MKCSWGKIKLGHRFGTVAEMTAEAVKIAELLDCRVSFEFNGVEVNVDRYTDLRPERIDAVLCAVRQDKKEVYLA